MISALKIFLAGGFGIRFVAAVAGVTMLAGTVMGWQVRDAFCDAAAAKARAERLERQVQATNAANKAAADQAVRDADELARLNGAIRDLESKVSDRQCFTSDELDSLRTLWR